jgi:hypothetical protein
MGARGAESLLVFPGPNRRKRFYAWAERFIEVLRCCLNCTWLITAQKGVGFAFSANRHRQSGFSLLAQSQRFFVTLD